MQSPGRRHWLDIAASALAKGKHKHAIPNRNGSFPVPAAGVATEGVASCNSVSLATCVLKAREEAEDQMIRCGLSIFGGPLLLACLAAVGAITDRKIARCHEQAGCPEGYLCTMGTCCPSDFFNVYEGCGGDCCNTSDCIRCNSEGQCEGCPSNKVCTGFGCECRDDLLECGDTCCDSFAPHCETCVNGACAPLCQVCEDCTPDQECVLRECAECERCNPQTDRCEPCQKCRDGVCVEEGCTPAMPRPGV